LKINNITLKGVAYVDDSSSINNVILGDGVKIAKRCSVFGSENSILEIGSETYIGMNSCINGFMANVKIGKNVSIAQNVNIMADSGPNASKDMQQFYPLVSGDVTIGDHSWIGANSVILPNVSLGKFCVVAANSLVTKSFDDYSVVAGNPARLIKMLK
jgi:acetyltransferase-like isoleucine patch superfamily enzyme